MVAVRRGLAADVLNRDDPLGCQLAHHRRGFRAVVNLRATADTDDQHIGLAQQHPVLRTQLGGRAPQVGKGQAPLGPAPEGGLSEPTSAEAVMGGRDAFDLEAGQAVGAGLAQKLAAGHRGSFIQQQAAGQDDVGVDLGFRQSRCAGHGLEGVDQNLGSTALDQQGAVAVAGDRHTGAGAGRQRKSDGCGSQGADQQGHGAAGVGPNVSRLPLGPGNSPAADGRSG